jgi:hypothetical protein
MANPDYVGCWNIFTDIIPGHGVMDPSAIFFLYVTGRSHEMGGIEKVRGWCADKFGASDFEGAIAREYFDFTKKYPPEAIAVGASGKPIVYKGIMAEEGKYSGKYTVDGTQMWVPKVWHGDFILERWDVNNWDFKGIEEAAAELRREMPPNDFLRAISQIAGGPGSRN